MSLNHLCHAVMFGHKFQSRVSQAVGQFRVNQNTFLGHHHRRPITVGEQQPRLLVLNQLTVTGNIADHRRNARGHGFHQAVGHPFKGTGQTKGIQL